MPALPQPFAGIRQAVEAWVKALADGWPAGDGNQPSAKGIAATDLGIRRDAFIVRLDLAVALGLDVPEWRSVDLAWAAHHRRRYRHLDDDYRAWLARTETVGVVPPSPIPAVPRPGRSDALTPVAPRPGSFSSSRPPVEQVVPLLRRGPMTAEEVAARLGIDLISATGALWVAKQGGAAIHERGGKWFLDAAPPLGVSRDDTLEVMTDAAGSITFAACGDMHLASKYARLDCLDDFYDQVAARGIRLVLNTGNWVDGEASFNAHDLLVHGMDAQIRYFAANYPRRAGVETWAVTGADHEGWWARREGVDVGRYAANAMVAAGRDDWRDLGYMEAYVKLVHPSTGKFTLIHVMHPGGGSAYAISYAPQKIVEGYDGGDKPGVLLIGHYHKAGYNLIRNVHTIQTGCFQDQTVFMRQKKLSAHLGGCFVTIKIDPETGAPIECGFTFRNYYVRSYYQGRWSQHGPVVPAERSAA